jgi:hypothetical protein
VWACEGGANPRQNTGTTSTRSRAGRSGRSADGAGLRLGRAAVSRRRADVWATTKCGHATIEGPCGRPAGGWPCGRAAFEHAGGRAAIEPACHRRTAGRPGAQTRYRLDTQTRCRPGTQTC